MREEADRKVAGIRKAFPAGIAAPALRALAGANLCSLEALTRVTEPELSQLHGMGPKAIGILKQAMIEQDVNFAEE